jgi:hypothetical protein
MIAPSGFEGSFQRMTDATELHPFFSGRYQLAGKVSRASAPPAPLFEIEDTGNVAAAG